MTELMSFEDEHGDKFYYAEGVDKRIAELDAMLEAALVGAGRPVYWPCSKHLSCSLSFRTGIQTVCPLCFPGQRFEKP